MNPDRTLLSRLPDGTVFDPPLDLRFTHPQAITFCVLDGGPRPVVIISRRRPHMFVYNALKKCDPNDSISVWKKVIADYGCEIVRGRLTRSVVQEFHRNCAENHGFPRYAVISGRLWRRLRVPGMTPFSAMNFWNRNRDACKEAASEIIHALDLRGQVFLIATAKTTLVIQ